MALRTAPPPLRLPMRVWDLPIRLFHWIVVVLVVTSYVSIHRAADSPVWMQVHLVSGYTMLALLLFRLAWGVVGSDTARFTAFLRSPLAGLRHLRKFRSRDPDDQVGHNEAGGWMVLAMLLLLAAQVTTGLFANDDGATEGPLAKYVSKATSNQLSGLHSLLFNVLLAFIALHVAAIVAYAVLRRHDLVRPMVTGKKRLPATTRAPRLRSPWAAALVLLVAAAIAVLVSQA